MKSCILKPWLFEEPLPEQNFALFIKDREDFILYDLNELKKITVGMEDTLPYPMELMPAVVAYVSVRKNSPEKGSNCSGAYSIAYSVRNPKYKGAGSLLIRIVSSELGVPLTSDRVASSTPDAMASWKRLAKLPDAEIVPLDNFYSKFLDSMGNKIQKQYYHSDPKTGKLVDGEPLTPTLSDDCGMNSYSLDDTANKVGALNAFKFSMNTSTFKKNHQKGMKYVKEMLWDGGQFLANLGKAASLLFDEHYH